MNDTLREINEDYDDVNMNEIEKCYYHCKFDKKHFFDIYQKYRNTSLDLNKMAEISSTTLPENERFLIDIFLKNRNNNAPNICSYISWFFTYINSFYDNNKNDEVSYMLNNLMFRFTNRLPSENIELYDELIDTFLNDTNSHKVDIAYAELLIRYNFLIHSKVI